MLASNRINRLLYRRLVNSKNRESKFSLKYVPYKRKKKNTSFELYCMLIMLSPKDFIAVNKAWILEMSFLFFVLLIKTFAHLIIPLFCFSILCLCASWKKKKNLITCKKAAAVFVEWLSPKRTIAFSLSFLTHRNKWWNKRPHLFRVYIYIWELWLSTHRHLKKRNTETNKTRLSIKHEIACQLDSTKTARKNPRIDFLFDMPLNDRTKENSSKLHPSNYFLSSA